MTVPRMRMLAGPNGSGKSTIKGMLPSRLLGVDINPDEIESDIKRRGFLDLAAFRVSAAADKVLTFLQNSELLANAGMLESVRGLTVSGERVLFGSVPVNSYTASAVSAFLRQELMESRTSFTFETVMSSPDKVEELRRARSLGYRTYLYYVATKSADINISRVENRVSKGGHDVPKDKIVSRYSRSLALLYDAIRHSNRAYIWDNSGAEPVLLAELEERRLEQKTQTVPKWFYDAVLKRFA